MARTSQSAAKRGGCVKKPLATQSPGDRVEGPFDATAFLPPRVSAMRDLILAAVDAHDTELLRPAVERNETLPIFGRGEEQPKRFADVIEALKKRSQDGKGQEILSLLRAIFAQPFARLTQGSSVTYVWPYAALKPDWPSDPDALLALLRCVRFAHLDSLTLDRVGIGSDGTWHFFWAG